MPRAIAIAIVLFGTGVAVALGLSRVPDDDQAHCGPGFVADGARCLSRAGTCPAPLVEGATGCDAPDVRVRVPAASIAIGPSDWEAEGRVVARLVEVQAFRIDAFEVTRARWGEPHDIDSARAVSGVTRAEATAFCAAQGGRLPTEDEWVVAAASAVDPAHRYPWGDTGAVCRRAAWGLASGPCATLPPLARGTGADTVGAHTDGDSPLGIHDLAGNVAEWVAPDPSRPEVGVAKGGSWQSALATDLRIWARIELPPSSRDPRVGMRCAYPL